MKQQLLEVLSTTINLLQEQSTKVDQLEKLLADEKQTTDELVDERDELLESNERFRTDVDFLQDQLEKQKRDLRDQNTSITLLKERIVELENQIQSELHLSTEEAKQVAKENRALQAVVMELRKTVREAYDKCRERTQGYTECIHRIDWIATLLFPVINEGVTE